MGFLKPHRRQKKNFYKIFFFCRLKRIKSLKSSAHGGVRGCPCLYDDEQLFIRVDDEDDDDDDDDEYVLETKKIVSVTSRVGVRMGECSLREKIFLRKKIL